jgi:hypothetical protein
MARAWKDTVMNRIQRCLSALTALAGALLAVFISKPTPSAAVDRPMPNVLMPSGDFLDTGAAAGHVQWRRGG